MAEALGLEPDQVAVASTGVIGCELPRDSVVAGLRAAVTASAPTRNVREAIVTSDRWPKRACLEVALRPEPSPCRLRRRAPG